MFIIFLKFSHNKSEASQFMDEHKAWVKKGFADNVFLMSGSIQPSRGGVVFAHNTTLVNLQRRVNQDPFVEHEVVSSEILEISPAMTDEKLAFLKM